MKIKKFRIKNFKSILDSGEIALDPKITTLIGENESGKTCILKALESFKRDYKYTKSDLCLYSEAKKKLDLEKIKEGNIGIITIWFQMESEDKLKLKEINPKLSRITNLKVIKYFDNSYKCESPDISLSDIKINVPKKLDMPLSEIKNIATTFKEKLNNHLNRFPPFANSKIQYEEIINEIVSFDPKTNPDIDNAFSDFFSGLAALPDKDPPIQNDIQAFSEEINPHKDRIKEILNEKDKDILSEALEILLNLMYFSDIEKLEDTISTSEYLKNKKKHKTLFNLIELSKLNIERIKDAEHYERLSSLLSASVAITGEINQFWTQEKIDVKINLEKDDIVISIIDNVINNYHPPSIRSQGFRWFFSFYINFMAGSKGEFRNTIILLDDPGVYLHASRQKDFLNAIEKISESNQIVFSTHSPFMIDREKLDRVRIITKKPNEGTLIKEKYWDSKGDALMPIRASIGMKIGDSLFTTKKNLLVEGYSDQIILEAISKLCLKKERDYIDTSKISIFAVNGADKMPLFATFCRIENQKFIALFDNDSKGRKASTELKDKFNINEKNIIMLNKSGKAGEDLVIENLIDIDFYLEALNGAYTEIFQKILNKKSINKDNLTASTFKGIENFFKENKIGTSGKIDKIKVAKKISDLASENKSPNETTISNFSNLFKMINEKLKVS